MRVEHPDTYKCDVCGKDVEHAESITVPVLWKTKQNEGDSANPISGVNDSISARDACITSWFSKPADAWDTTSSV